MVKGAEDVEVFSDTVIHKTTQSTSTSTGALRVEGGVGIKKDLFVGGGARYSGGVGINGQLEVLGKRLRP